MITPLQPEKFFAGQWTGKGQFRMHSILRLVVPDQTVQYKAHTNWLTDDQWMATEDFRLSRAASAHRTTFLRIVEPGRLHMTCDDIPGGADILLHERGFRFTPYLFRTPVAGRHMFVRCIDEASLDDQGVLHDTIKMYYAGIRLATMTMAIVIERDSSTRVFGAAQQPAEADSAGTRKGSRPLPASVGYREGQPPPPQSRHGACLRRRRGLECGYRRPLPPGSLARGRWAASMEASDDEAHSWTERT